MRRSFYVSAVSGFEIAVKASLKRLKLTGAPSDIVPPLFAGSGLTTLPITMEHSFGVFALPHHDSDPFDRLLVSQAIKENLTLVTSDEMLKQYPATVIVLKA
jgi:PIN domain nuclease of toxin-antitoxin system